MYPWERHDPGWAKTEKIIFRFFCFEKYFSKHIFEKIFFEKYVSKKYFSKNNFDTVMPFTVDDIIPANINQNPKDDNCEQAPPASSAPPGYELAENMTNKQWKLIFGEIRQLNKERKKEIEALKKEIVNQ